MPRVETITTMRRRGCRPSKTLILFFCNLSCESFLFSPQPLILSARTPKRNATSQSHNRLKHKRWRLQYNASTSLNDATFLFFFFYILTERLRGCTVLRQRRVTGLFRQQPLTCENTCEGCPYICYCGVLWSGGMFIVSPPSNQSEPSFLLVGG